MIAPEPGPTKCSIVFKDGSKEEITIVSFDITNGWLKLDLSDTKMRFINQDQIKEFTVE